MTGNLLKNTGAQTGMITFQFGLFGTLFMQYTSQ